jgi:hypothetical protein
MAISKGDTMRRGGMVVLSCLVALLLGEPSQADTSLGWRKGILLNVNLARVDGGSLSEIYDLDNRTTLGGGLIVLYPLSDALTLQTEVRYAARGAENHYVATDVDGNEITGTQTWKLNYVEVPILARVYVPTGSRLRPLFYAGPDLGFNVSSTVEDSETGSKSTLDDVANFDFGIAFGGGLEVGAGRGSLILDARYTLGLSMVFTGVAASEDKNRTLTFGLGYAF